MNVRVLTSKDGSHCDDHTVGFHFLLEDKARNFTQLKPRLPSCQAGVWIPKKSAALCVGFLQEMGPSTEGSEAGVFQVERSHFHI